MTRWLSWSCVLSSVVLSLLVDLVGPPAPKLKPEAPPGGDLSGWYEIVGKTSEGKAYTGKATIYKQQIPDTYVVVWMLANGNTTDGVLLKNPEGKEPAWLVTWVVEKQGKVIRGLTFYKQQGKELEGKWTHFPGDGAWGQEKLTWQAPHAPD